MNSSHHLLAFGLRSLHTAKMKFANLIVWLLLAGRVIGGDTSDHNEAKTGYDSRFVKDAGRIYTAPDSTAAGGITGTLPVGTLTHAMAIDSERVRVYRASPVAGSNQFNFVNLPVGKYDLVLVTKDRRFFEGLRLGETITLPIGSQANLEKRIAKADSYFNRHIIHRWGIVDDRIFALVERLRDQQILTQSGDLVKANIRRLEIIELTQATDDWQMNQTRHVYRQYEPLEKSPAFFRHKYVPVLSGIRVVTTIKELGTIAVPKD